MEAEGVVEVVVVAAPTNPNRLPILVVSENVTEGCFFNTVVVVIVGLGLVLSPTTTTSDDGGGGEPFNSFRDKAPAVPPIAPAPVEALRNAERSMGNGGCC